MNCLNLCLGTLYQLSSWFFTLVEHILYMISRQTILSEIYLRRILDLSFLYEHDKQRNMYFVFPGIKYSFCVLAIKSQNLYKALFRYTDLYIFVKAGIKKMKILRIFLGFGYIHAPYIQLFNIHVDHSVHVW